MKKLTLMALASSLAIAAAAPANAAIFISYSADGGATKTAITSGSGLLTASGTASGLNFTVSASGAPLLTSPDFSTNTIDIKSSGGQIPTVIFYFTQTDNTPFNGVLNSAFTSNVLSGSAQDVLVSSYYSTSNANGSLTGVGPGLLLKSNDFTAINTFTGNNALNVAGPFSTTITYAVKFGAGANGTFNTTAGLSAAVPEPATWGMMLLGFGVVGSTMRRRNAKTIASFA